MINYEYFLCSKIQSFHQLLALNRGIILGAAYSFCLWKKLRLRIAHLPVVRGLHFGSSHLGFSNWVFGRAFWLWLFGRTFLEWHFALFSLPYDPWGIYGINVAAKYDGDDSWSRVCGIISWSPCPSCRCGFGIKRLGDVARSADAKEMVVCNFAGREFHGNFARDIFTPYEEGVFRQRNDCKAVEKFFQVLAW